MKTPNKSLSWADNCATQQLVEQIIVLRAMVDAMTSVALEREAEIARLQALVDAATEVLRR